MTYANVNDLFVCFCLVKHLSTMNEFIIFKFSSKLLHCDVFTFFLPKIKEVIALKIGWNFLDHFVHTFITLNIFRNYQLVRNINNMVPFFG